MLAFPTTLTTVRQKVTRHQASDDFTMPEADLMQTIARHSPSSDAASLLHLESVARALLEIAPERVR